MQIDEVPSPNHDARRAPLAYVVLHYTGMESGAAALARLCDPNTSVSAHYLVWEDGRITRLVDESRRAWHAGRSHWQGLDDLNSRSIGIEIVNGGHDFPGPDGALPPYPPAQIAAVIALGRDILARHRLPPAAVLGHSDIAPTRKIDPGEHFPWPELAAHGLGLYPAETPPGRTCLWSGGDPSGLNAGLAAIGYDLSDIPAALSAFQRRFMPDAITGLADARTIARVAAVAAAYSTAASHQA